MVQIGKDLLITYVSPGALHNSNERRDYRRRHPGTRVELVDDVKKWLNTVDDPQPVLWMKGSAGMGKSVIAEAIASLCSQKGRLLGAFFVSESAPMESGRNDETRVVPTLAYQMARDIPLLTSYITDAIERNPLIFDLDITAQVEELIIRPLTIRSDEMSTPTPPMLFILDAIDEFSNKATQMRIVEAFCAAMERAPQQIPFKLLVTSRPVRTIQSAFLTPQIASLVRTISLDDNYPACGDIRTFLIENFGALRRTHPSPDIFPPIWPTEEDIDELIRRSSGQFLYAARVLNYVQDDDTDPIQRLQSVLSSKPYNYSPFKVFEPLSDFWDLVNYVLTLNNRRQAYTNSHPVTGLFFFCNR